MNLLYRLRSERFDRQAIFGTEGRGFDSLPARQYIT